MFDYLIILKNGEAIRMLSNASEQEVIDMAIKFKLDYASISRKDADSFLKGE